MTWWQRISMTQSHPQDLGLDNAGRIVLRMNIMGTKQPSATTVGEIIKILTTAGVGTFNTNIFVSSAIAIPAGNGPFLAIIETGGPSGIYQHNEAKPAYDRPTFAISIHGKSSVAARAMWQAAYDALSIVVNQHITP